MIESAIGCQWRVSSEARSVEAGLFKMVGMVEEEKRSHESPKGRNLSLRADEEAALFYLSVGGSNRIKSIYERR